jgi:hypothetical protein
VLLACVALLLGGCGYLGMYSGQAIEEWSAEVAGMPVHYRLVTGSLDGSAAYVLGHCTIALNVDLPRDLLTFVAAHEIGHCLDGAQLGWSSNGWRDEGCIYGSYYCSSREGFAQGYAYAYLEACFFARSPLGLLPADERDCVLPDPSSVTPAQADRLRGIAERLPHTLHVHHEEEPWH